jgi:hypothetical protein
MPQSKPSLTSRASSLKRLRLAIFPLQITALSRTRRALALRRATPCVTIQPAIMPALLILKV